MSSHRFLSDECTYHLAVANRVCFAFRLVPNSYLVVTELVSNGLNVTSTFFSVLKSVLALRPAATARTSFPMEAMASPLEKPATALDSRAILWRGCTMRTRGACRWSVGSICYGDSRFRVRLYDCFSDMKRLSARQTPRNQSVSPGFMNGERRPTATLF